MSVALAFGGIFLLLALAGVGYCGHAWFAVGQFSRRASPAPVPPEPVSLLKPLHGIEPNLGANLATFLDQAWDAPVELVAGVHDAGDPAAGAAAHLPRSAGRDVHLIIDARMHGGNAKISNLINMMPAAHHDLLVLSDSDMSVPNDYLARVAATLAVPGVGVVTCLYRGRGDAGFWSLLGAAGVSYQFLPNVLVGVALGRGQPCMGSTIAIRRSMLAAIGGFEAFADILADDHAIGAAVRARGKEIAIAHLLLVHAGTEASFTELMRHELRWAATVRQIVPLRDYLGMIVTYPVALALLAALFLPVAGLAMLGVAFVARALLWSRVDRWSDEASAPMWLLPLRDILSFVVFLASFGVRSVDWRGQRLTMMREGRIEPHKESSLP